MARKRPRLKPTKRLRGGLRGILAAFTYLAWWEVERDRRNRRLRERNDAPPF